MSHLPLTRNHLTKGHTSVLLAMRIMWFTMFCGQYQVRFPGRHQQTCCYSCKNGLNSQFNTTAYNNNKKTNKRKNNSKKLFSIVIYIVKIIIIYEIFKKKENTATTIVIRFLSPLLVILNNKNENDWYQVSALCLIQPLRYLRYAVETTNRKFL